MKLKKQINTANNPIDTIELINQEINYEEIVKTQHKSVIIYIYKQGEILKMFKEAENFFDNAGQKKYKIIGIYKLLKKNLVSKNQRCSLVTFEIICNLLSQFVKSTPACFLDKSSFFFFG